jgi:hypothetical protein
MDLLSFFYVPFPLLLLHFFCPRQPFPFVCHLFEKVCRKFLFAKTFQARHMGRWQIKKLCLSKTLLKKLTVPCYTKYLFINLHC